MSKRRFVLPVLCSSLLLAVFVGACSSGDPGSGTTPPPTGTAGTTAAAGTTGAGGTTSAAGTTGAAGTSIIPNAGTTGVGGSAAGGMSGGGTGAGGSGTGGTGMGGTGTGTGGSGPKPTMGCNMDPQGTDSQSTWVKHDIAVTGVDPAFVTKYAVNGGAQYNWTHRNYYLRLPTNYDSTKAYPITIGSSGCGGPETVGSEGGYAPLGIGAGETQAIQVALSYVLSSAANPDCGGAVFADDFPNSPEQQYLAAVVKDVQSHYCSDSTKVFLSGYSSGAFETVTLGCANSDILRGIGIQIGGGLRGMGPKPCKGPVAAMFVVGLQDEDNPIGPLAAPLHDSLGSAPARDEVLMRNGCTGSAHMPWDSVNYPQCEIYTGCPAAYPVVWCAITSGHLPDAKDPAVGKYRYDGLWKFWSTLP